MGITGLSFDCAAIVHVGLAAAADANAGKLYFRTECALCHSAEPGDYSGRR